MHFVHSLVLACSNACVFHLKISLSDAHLWGACACVLSAFACARCIFASARIVLDARGCGSIPGKHLSLCQLFICHWILQRSQVAVEIHQLAGAANICEMARHCTVRRSMDLCNDRHFSCRLRAQLRSTFWNVLHNVFARTFRSHRPRGW